MSTTNSLLFSSFYLVLTTIGIVFTVSILINKLLHQSNKDQNKDNRNTDSSSVEEREMQVQGKKQEEEEKPDYSNQPVPNVKISMEELSKHGADADTVWIGINGLVFDVTSRREMYTNKQGYGIFAGTDATRCLAKSSLDPNEMLPLGSLEGLTDKQLETLKQWEQYYRKRYPVVGQLEKKSA
jgi:membrane-associated progesterone receptor component